MTKVKQKPVQTSLMCVYEKKENIVGPCLTTTSYLPEHLLHVNVATILGQDKSLMNFLSETPFKIKFDHLVQMKNNIPLVSFLS